MAASGAGTMTAAIREIIMKGGNKPVKINSLYNRIRTIDSFKDVTNSQIKRKIIKGMALREEIIRAPMEEIDSKGRVRRVYGMRLKVSGAMRRRTAGLGIPPPEAASTATLQ